jgi:hypothetical protein
VLGLFLAASVRRNLERRQGACRLRGGLAVDADGMRATIRFDPVEVVVLRGTADPRARVRGSLRALVRAAVRPGLRAFLSVRVRGNPLFALRALGYLAP